jgi:hypothetical protein
MVRLRNTDTADTGQDSFLDVVTNIVGILIILVMVIGGRIQQIAITDTAPSADPPALGREMTDLAATLASAESEVEDLQEQARVVATAAAFTADARLELATAVSAAKAVIARRKQDGDAARITAAEAVAREEQLESEIARVERETQSLATAPAEAAEVLAYPTPIGRTVNNAETHFRLAGGRVAYIPLDELFELAKQQTRRHAGPISTLASRVESVGPAQGFKLDYVIEAKVDQARGQVLIRSREWVVRPAAEPGGEPIEEALAARSRFRQVLADGPPDTTVTLWCYPDSFAAYRQIREELHRLGVPTAGRPMPDGAPIGGSTDGSKSVVQ